MKISVPGASTIRYLALAALTSVASCVNAAPIALQHKGAVIQIPVPIDHVDVRQVDVSLLPILDDQHPMNTDELVFITSSDAAAYRAGQKMDLDVYMKVISADTMQAQDVPADQVRPFMNNMAVTFNEMIKAGGSRVRDFLENKQGTPLDPSVSVLPLSVDRHDNETVQMTMLVLSQYDETVRDFKLVEVVSSSVCYCSKRLLSTMTILRMKEQADIQRAVALNRRWFDRVSAANP